MVISAWKLEYLDMLRRWNKINYNLINDRQLINPPTTDIAIFYMQNYKLGKLYKALEILDGGFYAAREAGISE